MLSFKMLAFSNENLYSNFDMQNTRKSSNKSSGLWILPSYFNHACAPNLIRIFLSDLMLIYAKREIKAGEELTHSYIAFDSNYETRKLNLKSYDFDCDCSCCQSDKIKLESDFEKERKEILKK